MNNNKLKDNYFHLETHIKTYADSCFYESKTYKDIAYDICILSQVFSNFHFDHRIGVAIKSPYLLLITLLALNQKKLSSIIFPLDSEQNNYNYYVNEVHTALVLNDEDIQKFIQNEHPKGCHLAPIDLENEFVVIFSSGSTGKPKGIVLSFGNIFYSSLGFNLYFQVKPNNVSLLSLPFHHVSGLMPIWRSFLSGGSVTLDKNSKIDFISIVPTQLYKILKSEAETDWLKKITYVIIGGAYLSEKLKRDAEQLDIKLFETYGMTETSSLLSINGDILPYRSLVINNNGNISVGGETLALGYIQNNIFTPFKDQLITKDKGIYQNEKFKFLERSDLVFKSGGENINPLILEEFLNELGLFENVYITSIPDEKWGEATTLLYTMKDQRRLDEKDLIEVLQKKFPHFMTPKHIIPSNFSSTQAIKPNRLKLKSIAYNTYIKSIFSHDFLDNKSQSTMVFLHGFLGDKADFAKIAHRLNSESNFLFVDLPGHGDTLFKNFYSLDDFFRKIKDLISLYTDSPILYGYSMGGRIALELALNHISTQQLILESSGLGLHDANESTIRRKIDSDLFLNTTKQNLRKFLINWYEQELFFNYNKSENFEFEIDKKLLHSIDEWKNSLMLFSPSNFPLLESNLDKLKKTTLPVHYIYGNKDPKYAKFAQTINDLHKSNVQTYPIDNCGHNPHKTHTYQIVKILNAILKN